MSIDIERLKTDREYWDSVAPDGATHYNDACYHKWLKDCPVPAWHDNGWVEYRLVDEGKHAIASGISRPAPQRRGPEDGFPPVGAECEYAIASQSYRTGYFVGVKSSGSYVVETTHGELLSYHKHQIKFRPIQSPEEKAMEDIFQIIYKHDDYRDAAEALYRAGYRKTEGGE